MSGFSGHGSERSPKRMLRVTPVRAFTDNYIWLIHSPTDPKRVVAVDPGDAAPVESAVSAAGWVLSGVLITHYHPDHVGGLARLASDKEIPVFGPLKESLPAAATKVREGDWARFPTLGLNFAVLDVPGHTSGHVAYVGHGAAFCGDTLFSAGCGRLFEGTPAQMTESLSKLAALPDETLVYCAHEYTSSNLQFARAVEPDNQDIATYQEQCRQRLSKGEPTIPSSLAIERSVNPFLRCHLQTVKRAAEERSATGLNNVAEVFGVIRQWKDGFRG
jgi:hydroxyacylglutathione hydrolase